MATPFPFQSAAVLTSAQMNAITTLPTSTKTASHTLTIADVGTRVIMNSASATTITVNTSIFGASDVVEILNIGAGVCTVTAGTCTVGTSGSLALAQNAGGTLTFISTSASVFRANGVAASGAGLVCVKAETAFSAAASITADNVFSSSYTNYRIMIRMTAGGNINTFLRLRVGGVSSSAGNYNRQNLLAASTTVSGVRATAETSFNLNGVNGAFFTTNVIDLFAPFLAEPTGLQFNNTVNDGAYTIPIIYITNANNTLSTSFDGFEFFPSSSTLTGTYTVYGYGKAV